MVSALVIVPTYDERENLPELVRAILAQGDFSILVVDDNSPDGTGQVADALKAETGGRVDVLHRPAKLGLGTAYIAGFKYALAHGFDYIFEMDADFSHDPAMLPRFLEAMEGADLALGSRYVPGGGTVHWSLARRLISRGGSVYAGLILGLPIRDLTGGFKCFRRSVLAAIDLDAVRSNGYGFQIEMTYRAVQAGFRVIELPIVFVDRRVGQSKMSRRIVTEAMVMVWWLRGLRPRRTESSGVSPRAVDRPTPAAGPDIRIHDS
ncbi:MAG TPA: polyprenol monophosphomannose synthase [Dehalococcoidia bacterium]|nr:polyprenol monophosphomannose synthase [Dehalococcoidia bacterium]